MAYRVRVYSFSEGGRSVAEKILSIDIDVFRCEKITFEMSDKSTLSEEDFFEFNAHVFVGALGITVRKVSAFVKNKTTDPAVITVDEKAKNVIPVLSGHIGGANQLAEAIAKHLGAEAIITTGTDVNGYRAIDLIAAEARAKIADKDTIVSANKKLLMSEKVRVYVDNRIEVTDISKDIYELTEKDKADVCVVPGGIYVIGVGCRKNTDPLAFKETLNRLLSEYKINHEDIDRIASIDLKADEKAIVEYCKEYGTMFETYSANELLTVDGEFDESDFVKEVTGVSNVSERAAVYGAGLMGDTEFILKRRVENSITVSIVKVRKRIRLNGKA